VIPEADIRWRVLLVEDDEQLARTTAESLQRRPVNSNDEYAHVERVNDFDAALRQIEHRRYDVVILDIRDQAEAAQEAARGTDDAAGDEALPADKGLTLYNEIRKRRFLPIIFYSAVPHLAQEQNDPPFVTVVSKLSDEDGALRRNIIEVFDSGLPSLNRAIAQHVDRVVRDFMINFVEEHWDQLSGSEHSGDLAYMMVRRLARSLDSTFIPNMAGVEVALGDAGVHSTRLYIMPPLEERRTGDLVCDNDGNWFILLTPTCDLILHNGQPKAKYVILAACQLLSETDEYRTWRDSGASNITNKLERLIRNNPQGQQDRFYFLPAAWDAPDLVIDLQRLASVQYSEFQSFTRVATLDDPYAQSVVAQLGRYAGRIGTPDLDVSGVRERLQQIQK
jgi:CheY-like chemotaxis protein